MAAKKTTRKRKPVSQITDRAKRYRAVKTIAGRAKKCEKCGSNRFLTVDHKDGNESNGKLSNLRYLCKAHNNSEGAKAIRKGKGVRTRQYNPGADTLGQYVQAAVDHTPGAHDKGGRVLHETPKAKRSAFAKQIWAIRKKHGNPERVRNYTEQVKTSDGKTVFINVDESRGKWRAEGYPVIGGRIKRVGKPKIAIGESESDAYDKLVMSLEKNPRKSNANPAKRNLDEIDEAAVLTEEFQGRPAEKVVETVKGNKMRDDFSHLGWSEQFVFVPPSDVRNLDCRAISDYYNSRYETHSDTARAWREVQKKFDIPLLVYDVEGDKIELVASADGKQLYFLGKKQAGLADVLKDFRTDRNKDRVDLGELLSLTYSAQKSQAGDTEERPYYHVFGEEGGYPPKAYFDMLNKEIDLVGGTYHLNEADAGIRN